MRHRAGATNTATILLAGVVAGWPVLGWSPPNAPEALERGRILEKVVCQESPDQSYALYIPTSGLPGARRPVLYLLDPAARGSVAVERFRPAAEAFGWILVASNNSRNGPWAPNLRAIRAMWLDSMARLPLDDTRIYAGGFSGGARVATAFPRAIGRPIAGIIGVGAGIAEGGVKIETMGTAAYFGIVGLADFNYPEMKQLDRDLDGVSLPHRVLFYDAPHQWPDQAICRRAVGWMEVVAMRQGSRSKDEALIDELWRAELRQGESLLASGGTFWAAQQYDAVTRLFDGLRDVSDSVAEASRLRQSREYAAFLKNENRRDAKSQSIRRDLMRAYATAQEPPGDRTQLVAALQELKLDSLKKEAREAREIEDRALVFRVLVLFSVNVGQEAALSYSKKDWSRASVLFELAAETVPDGDARAAGLYYDLACVTALRGDGKLALKHLETAVNKGFSDTRGLENDKDLATLRTNPKFRELIERMKKDPAPSKGP